MKTFRERVLDKDVPTEAGERAMEMVVRALFPRGSMNDAQFKAWIGGWLSGRDLLHSIDDWRPLWKQMTEEQLFKYINWICDGPEERGLTEYKKRCALLLSRHHLEACLKTLEVECPECGGSGYKSYCEIKQRADIIDCTCTNGKITLMERWEGEVS